MTGLPSSTGLPYAVLLYPPHDWSDAIDQLAPHDFGMLARVGELDLQPFAGELGRGGWRRS